ncbi:MAG TPA: tetratricopeptide repeat protein [Noviherbaspirillum sp.]|jgi:tetratricopeptide (TPR) repeat protein|uniref:tetratricopeptide repeat protein n=1 Tax=Noviherbaspirillum sp. TaxID=1926288 RepID=UPI002F94C977
MRSFTIADVESRYGIRRSVVSELVREGFVRPARGRRKEYRFSFQDVVMLRMAQDLFSLGIPPRKTSRFLRQLQRELPDAGVVGARVSAAGRELVVREDGRLRNADGQLVIDFAADRDASLVRLPQSHPHPAVAGTRSADEWYNAGLLLDGSDPLEAIECYRRAIEMDRLHADAYVNLGCLLIDGGQFLEAYAVLQEGAAQCPRHALLRFNLGIACEDLDRPDEAIQAYGDALRLDPGLGDAHFNLARLHEALGHQARAIRHYSAYRRLQR